MAGGMGGKRIIFHPDERSWQWGGDRDTRVALPYISDAERIASTCEQIDVENE